MEKYLVKESNLYNFVSTSLQKYGMSKTDAEITASCLVRTDKWGIYTHGTKNLFGYIQKAQAGGVSLTAKPEIKLALPSVMVIDANNTLGFVSATFAMQKAVEMAKKTGVAMVFSKNCCHFGAAGCYVNIASEQGMVGGVFSNVDKKMVIPGAKGMVMGHNPFALSAPAKSQPSIFFDASTSNVASLKVLRAKKDGVKIPLDWIVDKDGKPTDDPSHYPDEGALLPIGNHKGYCIATFIEVITSLMTGSTTSMSEKGIPSWCFDLELPNEISQTFIAIDAEQIAGKGVLKERVEQMINDLHNAPKADGVDKIYVPGEMEWNNFNKAEKSGYVILPKDVYAELAKLEEMSGLKLEVKKDEQ